MPYPCTQHYQLYTACKPCVSWLPVCVQGHISIHDLSPCYANGPRTTMLYLSHQGYTTIQYRQHWAICQLNYPGASQHLWSRSDSSAATQGAR